jgi:two-component system, cell cycle response regulator DivK
MVVLVVEDNPQNLYLARYLLEHALGYQVVEARTARDGLALARKTPPDMIITDIQLPEMDGYELAVALKDDQRLAHVPIVAMTSYAMPKDRARADQVGFDAYFEKPIDPASFPNEIKAIMERRSLAR